MIKKQLFALFFIYCIPLVTLRAEGNAKKIDVTTREKTAPLSISVAPTASLSNAVILVELPKGLTYARVNIINKRTGYSVYSMVYYNSDLLEVDLGSQPKEEYLLSVYVDGRTYTGNFILE